LNLGFLLKVLFVLISTHVEFKTKPSAQTDIAKNGDETHP